MFPCDVVLFFLSLSVVSVSIVPISIVFEMDNISGPKIASNQVYRHNDVKMWILRDHCPTNITIQEDDEQDDFTRKKRKIEWADMW